MTCVPGVILESFTTFPRPASGERALYASDASFEWSASPQRWSYGFATFEKPGLHLFDRHGAGFLKVFPRVSASASAFDTLVERHGLTGRTAADSVWPEREQARRVPLGSKEVRRLRELWSRLVYPRGVAEAAELFGTTRAEVLRFAPRSLVRAVPRLGVAALLKQMSARGLGAHLVVRTPEAEHGHTGPLPAPRVTPTGLDVLDDSVHLHVATDAIAEAVVVAAPSAPPTLELLDGHGNGLLALSCAGDEADVSEWRKTLHAAIPDLRFGGLRAWP